MGTTCINFLEKPVKVWGGGGGRGVGGGGNKIGYGNLLWKTGHGLNQQFWENTPF